MFSNCSCCLCRILLNWSIFFSFDCSLGCDFFFVPGAVQNALPLQSLGLCNLCFPSHLPPVLGRQNHYIFPFHLRYLWRSDLLGILSNQLGLSAFPSAKSLMPADVSLLFNFLISVCSTRTFSPCLS